MHYIVHETPQKYASLLFLLYKQAAFLLVENSTEVTKLHQKLYLYLKYKEVESVDNFLKKDWSWGEKVKTFKVFSEWTQDYYWAQAIYKVLKTSRDF